MTGLPTVEGAVFALTGLLAAFSISGALQRFDERRQLVTQEANAVSTAYDRLALFEKDVARELQSKLKEYVQANSRPKADMQDRTRSSLLLIQNGHQSEDDWGSTHHIRRGSGNEQSFIGLLN